MSNICPLCRQPPSDPMLVKCERCKVPFVDDNELRPSLSEEQLKYVAGRVLKSFKFWVVIFIGILSMVWLSLEIIDYFTGRKVQGVLDGIQASVSNSLDQAHTIMVNTIAARFREPEIQALMEAVVSQEATARIDTTADRLIDQKLTALIKPQLDNIISDLKLARTEIHALTNDIVALRQDMSSVNDEQQFLSLANSARLYSLQAFLILEKNSQTTNAYAKDAGQITWALRRDMEIDRQSLSEYIPIESRGDDYQYKGPFTSEEIAARLKIPSAIEGAANFARKESLKYFVPILVDLAQKENNLWVQNRITYAISALSGEEFYPWSLPKLTNWWAKSSSQFTNWPFVQFDKGTSLFNEKKYEEAASRFLYIVSSDPLADQSRALAIVATIQAGKTNTAITLYPNWKYPDGRWARWARAYMNLQTGDLSQATGQFAEIASEFRTFQANEWMRPGNPILQKIDLELYKRRLQELRDKE